MSKSQAVPKELQGEEFEEIWREFKEHRKRIGKPFNSASEKMMLDKLKGIGRRVASLALRDSIISGWPDVYPKQIKDLGEALGPERGSRRGEGPAPRPPIDRYRMRVAEIAADLPEPFGGRVMALDSKVRKGENVESLLREIEDEVVDAMVVEIPEEELSESLSKFESFAQRCSPEYQAQAVRSALKSMVRRRFGLPQVTLYPMMERRPGM